VPLLNAVALIVTLLLVTGCDQLPSGFLEKPLLLEEIQESGTLKVLTRFDPTTYYEGPEGPIGLEYDLVQLFASKIGVEAEFVVPNSFGQIISRIMVGDAHLAAAGITVTEKRKQLMRFAPAYRKITEQLVYRSGNNRPKKIPDLYGGILEAINGSSHVSTLTQLRTEFPELDWIVNTELEAFELLELVDKGLIDYTVADSDQLLLTRHYYPKLHVAFNLSKPLDLAWAFPHGEDNSLYDAATGFFEEIKQNGTLAGLIEKHYGHTGALDYVGRCTFRKHFFQRLPKLRPYFEQAANETGIDWRLLAAIGYQESHWKTNAVSPTGVRGIMMLTQATAKELGIRNRSNPHQSIDGGARYFKMRRKSIPPDILEPDLTWMALAAYNVGPGHLEDARVLAAMRGEDPDRWIVVKETLPLLSQRRWYRKTKHGYARGREPVRYVKNIRNYYALMVWLTSSEDEEKQADPRILYKKQTSPAWYPEQRTGSLHYEIRFLRKNSFSKAEHCCPSTPVCHSTWWLKNDHCERSTALQTAPRSGSSAPKTRRLTRACRIAPMHITQGSSVT